MGVLRTIVNKLGRLPAWFWLAGMFILAMPAASAAPAEPTPEYKVKAVFLFNFAQFVEWPESAFTESNSPVVIGILGDDPFGRYLDELVQNEKIGNRPLIVQRFRRVEDLTPCHILFVSRAVAGQFDKFSSRFDGRHLLTVGDVDNFNRLGGIVRFATEAGKIRLRINVDSARRSELTISSKILRWATIVTAEKG